MGSNKNNTTPRDEEMIRRTFREEMRQFRQEMRQFRQEMRQFRQEMRQYRQEMRQYRQEMRQYRQEMRQVRHEMLDREEMQVMQQGMQQDRQQDMQQVRREMLDREENCKMSHNNLSPPRGPSSHGPLDETVRIVRKEMGDREEHCKMPPNNLPHPKMLPPQWQLDFMNKPKNPTFSTDQVRAENGDYIKVAMYDTYTNTKSIISGDNILASVKVKLILFDAELCTANLSPREFVQNVLTKRIGKGPILTGRSLIIRLENGIGTFKNVFINDNSKWTKNGFRLAVMVKGEGEEGYFNGERVREGVSESFQVLDRRGKASQKPDRPKLKDSIRCIKKIGKDRTSLLKKRGIITVEHFLRHYYKNESELREMCGLKSESSKTWESMVEHATQSADEYHAKCTTSNNSSQPQQALVDPMERNESLGTNVGHGVASVESLEPNPSKKVIIEGDVPATTNNQLGMTVSCDFFTDWTAPINAVSVPPSGFPQYDELPFTGGGINGGGSVNGGGGDGGGGGQHAFVIFS